MEKIHDKKLAKLLLEVRSRDGYTIRALVHQKAGRFIFFSLALAAILITLAFCHWWYAFGLVLSFASGVLFCYGYWFRARQRYWPLDKRIINWPVVETISEDEPSA